MVHEPSLASEVKISRFAAKPSFMHQKGISCSHTLTECITRMPAFAFVQEGKQDCKVSPVSD